MRRSFGLVIGAAVGVLAALCPVGRATAAEKWTPSAYGGLDCNGYSPVQKPIVPNMTCPDPHGIGDERFEDNGHYVGHDEPVVEFYSTTPGSGNSAEYTMKLPVDPASPPNGSFTGPVWAFQNEIAFWYGMVMCDDQSWPEGHLGCTPDSDSNIQVPLRPDHAGTAYMELQFYPPGYAPVISCDQHHWCARLTITSLQLNFDFTVGNFNCIEPQASAFITLSGAPTGPVGPDNFNMASFTPTDDVLKMNPGDDIRVAMHDTPAGFETILEDVSTGQTGTMVASAANGWRHILWDPENFTCQGAPYTFHPMYSTAAPPVPSPLPTGPRLLPTAYAGWTAHSYNVAYSGEIGHFENPDGDDDDNFCVRGPRNSIPGCISEDLDFDGHSYYPDWPNGSPNFPTPNYFTSPRSLVNGHYTAPYTQIAFETDTPIIEDYCNIKTGAGCNVPPTGPGHFYPWFHLTSFGLDGSPCTWALSNDLPNQTNNFGGMTNAWGGFYRDAFPPYLIFNFRSKTIDNPCP